MKKRLMKKSIKGLSDKVLFEHVGYTENKRFRRLLEKEFDKRFKKTFQKGRTDRKFNCCLSGDR